MCPISTVLRISSVAPQLCAGVPRLHLPQIQKLRLEIFAGRDVAQMIIVLVRAGDHVAPALERAVRQNRHVRHADRPERPGLGAEPVANLLRDAPGGTPDRPPTAPNLVSLS